MPGSTDIDASKDQNYAGKIEWHMKQSFWVCIRPGQQANVGLRNVLLDQYTVKFTTIKVKILNDNIT